MRPRPPWTLPAVALLIPAALAVLLYAYTLRLPFFLDDGLLFAMIRDHPGGGLPGFLFWGGSPSFPYYRPLVFSLWEWQGLALGGRWEPITWHALNVLLYALSAAGVSALAQRLSESRGVGLLAGLGVVLFPFNFNAVQWVASLFHLMALAGILAALLSVGPRIRWAGLTGGAFVALFSHENGVLLLPLLAGLFALTEGRGALRRRRTWAALGLVAALTALFGLLFVTMPRAGGTGGLRLDQLTDNAAALLQGIAWPLGALLRVLTGVEGDTVLFSALAAVTVAALLAAVWTRRRAWMPLALYGLAWYGLAILPAALFLETDYIFGSWRLLYVAAPGAALIWALGLGALWSPADAASAPRRLALMRGLAALLMLWSLGVALRAAGQRQDEALRQAAYLRDLRALVESQGAAIGDSPLIVNAPAFLAPTDAYRLFPVRGMGVIFLADFAPYDRLIQAETGQPFPQFDALAYADILQPPPGIGYAPYQTFPFGTDFTTQVRAASALIVTHFAADTGHFYPVYVGRAGTPGPDRPLVIFPGTGVALTQAQAALSAPDLLTLTLRWQVQTPADLRPVFRVTCDGESVGESALMPWGNIHPFRVWTPGEAQTEIRHLPLTRRIDDPACLEVRAHLHDEADPARRYPPSPADWRLAVGGT